MPKYGRSLSLPWDNTLINKADLRVETGLLRYEADATGHRLAELQLNPIKGYFDLEHLQKIHKHLFQDVYYWAGQLRTISIGKEQSLFIPVDEIYKYANNIFGELKNKNHLRGMRKISFINNCAVIFGQINKLHPFREGNGRAQRVFIEQLAEEAGYLLDFSMVSREMMIDISIQGNQFDYSGIKKVISENIKPLSVKQF